MMGNLPKWIYQRNRHLAQNYHECMKRSKTDPESARKVEAIHSALDELPDDNSRDFVRQNLFDHVKMQRIDLPMSDSTMKRIRSRFICLLAAKMGES